MSLRGHLLLFADDFDAVAVARTAEPSPPPPPPPPSYGQHDLDAACAVARAEGFAQGREAAATATATQVAATLARVTQQLDDAAEQAGRVADESATAMARMLIGAVLAGFPLLRERHGGDELRQLIRVALRGLLLETRVTCYVHPSMAPLIEQELAHIRPGERAHIGIEPSDDMPPGDARIAWPHGAAVRDTVRAHAEILGILAPLGLLPDATVNPETR